MKRGVSLFGLLVFNFVFQPGVNAAAAPPQNSRALQWHEIGRQEKDLDKKIEAFNKALGADPRFVEALYDLGLAYKEKQDYGRAEQSFAKAFTTKPGKLKTDFKVAILYELANTYNRQGKTKKYEETLRQTKGLASDTPRGATISFELGRLLYQQNRYAEALAELQEGQRLYPAKRDYFGNLIKLIQTGVETEQLYAAAARARSRGNLAEAKAILLQVQAQNSADKKVEAQIAAIAAQIETASGARALTEIYEQAQKYESAGKVELAITSYENLTQKVANYKDAAARLQNLQQQLAQKKLQEELDDEYVNGLEALRVQEWTRAVVIFEKIVDRGLDFRDARQRLAEAQTELARENTDTMIARYYADGVTAMNRHDLAAALAAFAKVRELDPNYRDAATRRREAESQLLRKPSPVAVVAAAPPVNLDSLYNRALAAMEQKDWLPAVVALEKLQVLKPNYRDVVDRLAEARARFNTPPRVASAAPPKNSGASSYLGGAIAALIILPALGIVAFSPTMRAKLYLLRSNYDAAAKIYERLLALQPGRLKLYAPLAYLYLRLGRRDQDAMKIYKMTLQLNLATPHRDELNALVAQNYLTEGRTDSEAIAVFEKVVRAEKNKGEKIYARPRR